MAQTPSNRLANWDYTSHHAYHVTICTKEKLKILGSVTTQGHEPKVTLSAIGEAAYCAIAKFTKTYENELQVEAHVIMPNHIHLLLRLTDPERALSSYVASFKAAVTRDAKALGFKGTLWQRNYHDHIIRGEEDYLATIEYIQNNPGKWAEDRFYQA